jgi:hypothetical protein
MEDGIVEAVFDRMTFQPKPMRTGDRIEVHLSGPYDRSMVDHLNELFGGPVKVMMARPTTEEVDEMIGQSTLDGIGVDE